MNKFKAGDKVYYPPISTKVLTAEKNIYNGEVYIIRVCNSTFTSEGKQYELDSLPTLLHATPENHALLEKLYGKEFQKPPTKPTSKDIIQALLNSGHRYVPCYVSNDFETPNEGSHLDFIICVKDDGKFYNQFGRGWKYATPFSLETGQPITELPQ